jgi:hypothetical protein
MAMRIYPACSVALAYPSSSDCSATRSAGARCRPREWGRERWRTWPRKGFPIWTAARRALFHCLAPLASRWDAELGLANGYPGSFQKFDEAYNREGGRSVYAHRLGAGGYLALQQRVADSCSFPFQVVALLSQPGVDFDGGEFVLTERRPRMQSRPAVIPLQAGDAAIICTSYRSTKGTHGFYRTNFKHAVSKVHSGVRLGLHLSFHDIDRPVN